MDYVNNVEASLDQSTSSGTAKVKSPFPPNRPALTVYETTDYEQFRLLEGNRGLNPIHLARLTESFAKRPLVSVVIVNEAMEVIDGQHRLAVAKALGVSVYFLVVPGYGLTEIHTLNANQRNWNADDFLAGYCSQGREHYLAYRDFKKEFGFGHTETRSLLTGVAHSGKDNAFFEGRFEIADLDRAYRWAEMLRAIAPYYDGWRRRSFINACLGIFKRPQFDYNRFLQKLKSQPTRLKDCVDIAQYTELIEDIYNYRCADRNKVNLRF